MKTVRFYEGSYQYHSNEVDVTGLWLANYIGHNFKDQINYRATKETLWAEVIGETPLMPTRYKVVDNGCFQEYMRDGVVIPNEFRNTYRFQDLNPNP